LRSGSEIGAVLARHVSATKRKIEDNAVRMR